MQKRNPFLPVLGILVLTLLSLSVMADNTGAENKPTRFIILGDRTGGHIPGVYEDVVEEVERLRPDFIMTVGDMIEGYTNNEAVMRDEWAEYKSIIAPLTMPIYFTPGNHDITTDAMEPVYREVIGDPYYSFDIDGIHFVILDNSRWSSSDKLPTEQITWLTDDLQKNGEAKQTMVFFHKPFWETTITEGKPDTLHAIFKNLGVDAVFSGHYHTYLSGKYDGILYTCIGSSGAEEDYPHPAGLDFMYAWVTVDENGIHITPIKAGSALAWDIYTADENNLVYPAQSQSISFPEPFVIGDSPSADGVDFNISVKNFSDKLAIHDTIQWNLPLGWDIEPKSLPIDIAADSTGMFSFKINNHDLMYPVPQLSLNFPYAVDKAATARAILPIARQTACHYAKAAPKIDGDISDAVWKDPVVRLISPSGEQLKTDSTEFYFAYDDKNLYLAARCYDPEIDSISVVSKKHDDDVFGDDCVGFILQPDPVDNKDLMYLVYVNPKDVVFDQIIGKSAEGYFEGDPKWDCQYKSKSKIGDNYWSVEMQIPFKQFDKKLADGAQWGVNFRRKQPRVADAAQFQIPWQYGPDFLGRLAAGK